MGYKLDTKDIDISGKRLSKIGSETTGDIYRYKSMALRIFKIGKQTPIDLDTANYLKDITTDRILLPKNILFYNNSFRGFSFKLVNNKGKGQKIINQDKDDLIEEITLIERDIESLSNKKILLSGIDPVNTVFNGELYITDPTKFRKLDLMSTIELEEVNKYQFHLLLTSLITSELRRNNFDSRYERRIKEELLEQEDIDTLATLYGDVIGDNDSIKQKVRRMKV